MRKNSYPDAGTYDVLVSAEVAAAGKIQIGRGHRCCVGCCDMRRAVIIMNLVEVAICIFYIMYFAFLISFLENTDTDLNMNKEEAVEVSKIMEHRYMILLAMKLPFALIGVYGAVKFKMGAMVIVLAGYIAQIFTILYAMNPLALVTTLLFAYPNAVFLYQLKSEIMSELNYPDEKFSCCCI